MLISTIRIIDIVVAGFSNPLPDTLHLLFSWFVYVCVFGRVYACLPAACTCVSRAVGRLRQPLHTCAVGVRGVSDRLIS